MKPVALLSSLVLGVIAFGVFDLHRVIIRAAWPVLEAFWFTYIAF